MPSHSGRRSRRAARPATRRFRITAIVAVLGACVLGVAMWSALGGAPAGFGSGGQGGFSAVPAGPGDPQSSREVLQVSPAPYQLPSAISREVVLGAPASGGGLLLAGGTNSSSASTAAVTMLNPVTGATSGAGRLAAATHDAAGATLHGQSFIFGGGSATSVPAVQAITTGHAASELGRLPTARSDVSAVTAGSSAYLVGGYDGSSYDPSVLATADGKHFSTAARLPVPVRYAGVAVAGQQIWVFGGETPKGPTSVIQRVDPGSGKATVAGHLPQPVQGASAVSLDGEIYIAGGQVPASSPAASPGTSSAGLATSRSVLRFSPGDGTTATAGQLPVPVAYAGSAVAGGGKGAASGTGYLIGGEDGKRVVPTVTTLRLVSPAAAVTSSSARSAPWLGPPESSGHLIPGSDPSVLPSDMLIADHKNNRLVIVDPQGRIRWKFPQPGCLAKGQTFLEPDDAFFSPDGKYIIATQEDDYVISVINVATCKITYRYGTPGVPGSGPDHVYNPDDAMLTPAGKMIAADIKNCRIIAVRPPAHRVLRQIGRASHMCTHNPPQRFGSPNGAFPMADGDYLVTEIDGDWVDEMSVGGKVAWSANPPGVAYPSDTNEVYPGRYLTVDYSPPGQVVEFNSRGALLWRMGGFNKPSLAVPLPNGDVLLNDDYNHRVVVVDPRTHKIVWQYGHTGVRGSSPGYLYDPDGVDLVPPDSLLITHAPTMGEP